MKDAYLRSVRALLDCPAWERERLLARLDSAVTAYLEDVPGSGEGDIATNFGTPEDCAARLLEECAPEVIFTRRRKENRRFYVVIAVLAALLIGIAGITGYWLARHGIVVFVSAPWNPEDWTPIGRNSKGESFGTIIQAETWERDLDLIAAVGTEGQTGYIRESDTVWGKWKDSIHTPEDSQKYMEELHSHPQKELIPLYDSEGNVIGEYLQTNWSERAHPDEDLVTAMKRMEGGGQ